MFAGGWIGLTVIGADRALARDFDAVPRFVDATAVAGLEHVFRADAVTFVVGGGGAAFDCDDNGLPDLFLAGGLAEAALYRNVSDPGAPIALEREDPDRLGLSGQDRRRVSGAYPLDLDGDGVEDLFVLRAGRNRLLRGLGDCRFEDATDAFGLPAVDDPSAAFSAIWLDESGLPVLVIGNYVDRSRALQKRGNCAESYVLAPIEARRYGKPIALRPTGCALSALFVDWSGAGAPALRIANDRQYADPERGEQLFRIEADDGQGAVAAPYGPEDGWVEERIWGMGLAAVDLDADGRPEIAVSNMADNRVFSLVAGANGAPTYENRALERGAMAQRPHVGPDLRPSTSWHVAFEDFNNDGYWDLWIVKGNVDSMPNFAAFDPDSLLLGRSGGGFREAGFEAGLATPDQGRGGAAVDLNRDGLLDLVTVNRNGPTRLMQGVPTSRTGAHLDIVLRGSGANRRAVGALVEVALGGRVLRREVVVGGGHAGGVSAPLHFGLGDASRSRVRVRWPDGAWSPWREADANSTLTLVQSEAAEAFR